MKREIKFRGYDPDTKRWYYGSLVKQNKTTYVTSEDYDQNPSNTEWFIFWDEMTDWCLPNRHLRGSVDPKSIGEYTGLHDKNGREIYEGDIIVTHPKSKYEDPKSGVVQYGGSCPSFIYKAEDGEEYDIWSSNAYRTYEAIGNIFEDEQLLEGKQ